MTWTRFHDMHSGGFLKEPPFSLIFIELPENESIRYFYHKFGHHPMSEACRCCGENYSIDEGESFAQLTGYERDCKWDDDSDSYVECEKSTSVSDFMLRKDVLVIGFYDIYAEDIPSWIPDPEMDDEEED